MATLIAKQDLSRPRFGQRLRKIERGQNLRHGQASALFGCLNHIGAEALFLHTRHIGVPRHHRADGGNTQLCCLLHQIVKAGPLDRRKQQMKVTYRVLLSCSCTERHKAAALVCLGDLALPLPVPPIEQEHRRAYLKAHDIHNIMRLLRAERDATARLQRRIHIKPDLARGTGGVGVLIAHGLRDRAYGMSAQSSAKSKIIKDARPTNWVDRSAPKFARPYLKLARADRPIGVWLLLWPCWWSLAMASPSYQGSFLSLLGMMGLFVIGAYVMRGAGCTYNDIVDKDFDGMVERTALRPIPSGQVSVLKAWAFLIAQALIGFVVLIQFNTFTIALGVASLGLIALYPFMKRWTWWPQAFLGLTFNWGALMGWSAIHGGLAPAPIVLYLGAILWTLGYDTIYAHQDTEDDALIGVKSSARRLGAKTVPFLSVVYSLAILLFGVSGALAGMHWIYFVFVLFFAAHLAWQIRRMNVDDPVICLAVFKSNRDAGMLLFLACFLGAIP